MLKAMKCIWKEEQLKRVSETEFASKYNWNEFVVDSLKLKSNLRNGTNYNL